MTMKHINQTVSSIYFSAKTYFPALSLYLLFLQYSLLIGLDEKPLLKNWFWNNAKQFFFYVFMRIQSERVCRMRRFPMICDSVLYNILWKDLAGPKNNFFCYMLRMNRIMKYTFKEYVGTNMNLLDLILIYFLIK